MFLFEIVLKQILGGQQSSIHGIAFAQFVSLRHAPAARRFTEVTMLLTLKIWEWHSVTVINKTIDDAMLLLSKANNSRREDEDSVFPFDEARG
jgi:hypothetical protein